MRSLRSSVVLLGAVTVMGAACVVEAGAPEEGGGHGHDPVELVASHDHLEELLGGPSADGWSHLPPLAADGAFNRVVVMFDAAAAVAIEARTSPDGGETWGSWRPLELSFAESGVHNAGAALPEGGTHVELRFLAPREAGLTFLHILAFETESASDGTPVHLAGSEAEQALVADTLDVVSRAAWGAQSPRCSSPSQDPNRVTIHYTEQPNSGASDAVRVKQVQDLHRNQRGWCDIGYHLLIGRNGQIFQGRYETTRGAHAGTTATNQDNVGISFIGTYDDELPPTVALEAAAAALAALSAEHGISLDRQKVKGHREYKPTTCPGDALYQWLGDLLELAAGGDLEPPPPPGCSSATLGAEVPHDTRVQVAYAGCGLDTCAWYRCDAGGWDCDGPPPTGAMAYPHAQCAPIEPNDPPPVDDGNGGPAPPSGDDPCAVEPSTLRMRWSSCASSMEDCYLSAGSTWMSLPSTGPVVKEAHLVTTADGFGSSWPSTATSGLSNHYALSEAASGYSMTRHEVWAPAGEGGSQYGQGSTGQKLPVLDEAWYVNMNWRDRPERGTRMIVKNPANGRAVVASAGWETGPGAKTSLAGVTEEIHHYLGTTHLDDLTVGFAQDQSLTFGPVTCGASSGPSDPPPVDDPTPEDPPNDDPPADDPPPDDPPPNDGAAGSYQDLPSSHPAFAAAEDLRARAALWGCAPGFFCPDDPLTRDELGWLLAMLHEAAFSAPSSPAFSDVGPAHWAYDGVQELSAKEITFGCGGGAYCPDAQVSRASFAVYLRRARALAGVPGSPASDVASSHWAASSIGAVLGQGLMDPCPGGGFCPDQPITRADAARFAVRAFP